MGVEIDRRPRVPKGGKIVPLAAAALTLSRGKHADRTVRMDYTDAACVITLPPATGSGDRYRVAVGAVNTNGHKIQVTGDDTIKGCVTMLDNDSNAATAYAGSGTDDTITMNGTTTGGQVGDWIEFEDIKADVWTCRAQLLVPAGSNVADPFSAAVT